MPKTIDGQPVNEAKWEEAKRLAAKQGQSDNFALITSIYKKLVGMKGYTFETDSLSSQIINIKGNKTYVVKGYISTSDMDLENDIITKRGLKAILSQVKNRDIMLDMEHDLFRSDNNNLMSAGRIVDANLDDRGVFVTAHLNPKWKRFDEKGNITMTFSDLWTNIKTKFTKAFSITFDKVKSVMKEVNGVTARLIDDLSVINIALTGVPINPGAVLTGSSMKGVMMKALEDQKIMEKAYRADGVHQHTPENVDGIHNHPELEQEIKNVIQAMDQMRRDDASNTNTKGNKEADKMSEEQKQDNAEQAEAKADTAEAKEETKEAEKPAEEAKKEEPEQKAQDMEALTKQLEALTKQVEASEKKMKAMEESEVFKAAADTRKDEKVEKSQEAEIKSILDVC